MIVSTIFVEVEGSSPEVGSSRNKMWGFVMIALAIANAPKIILADEPSTALDVTVQAQVLELLKRASVLTGATVLIVTHDMGVVAGLADRIAIMYGGKIVEDGSVSDVFENSQGEIICGECRRFKGDIGTKRSTGSTLVEGSQTFLAR